MEEIFRFLMLRPPEPADPVQIDVSARFREAVVEAQQQHEGRDALRVAAEVITRERGISAFGDLALAPRIVVLGARLDAELVGNDDEECEPDLSAIIEEELGARPTEVAASEDYVLERERLSDLLVAAKILSRDAAVPAARIEDVLRLMDLVRRVAEGTPDLDTAAGIRRALTRPTVIATVTTTHRLVRPGDTTTDGEDPTPGREDELNGEAGLLAQLAEVLQNIDPQEFAQPDQRPGAEGVDPEPGVQELVGRQITENVRRGDLEPFKPGVVQALVADLGAVAVLGDAGGPQVSAVPRLMVAPEVAQGWPAPVQEALTLVGIDLAVTPVPTALDLVTRRLSAAHTELGALREHGTELVMLGSSVVDISGLQPARAAGTIPSTYGTVQPVGVGDLLVVREQIKRYEGGELAHVENVLDGERRKRMHKRARTTEETVTVEVETTRDEERDTQTTERFELQRETSTLIKQDQSFKAGLSVSGSYGPTIEFKASTDFAMNNAKEESAKTASKYSKEVTERASTKVSERRREERILRTLEVFEEVNEHGIDNPAGNGHVIGAYQWVDKVYEAQVFNYGKRMMFDFILPEPGAFWIHAASARPRPGASLTRPVPFTLTPAQLTEFNYEYYVQLYQVAGVKPPPVPYVTVARSFEGAAASDAQGAMTKVADLPILDGYQAVTGHITVEVNTWNPDWTVEVAVGNEFWRRQAGTFVDHYFTFDRETGAVPVAIKTFQVAELAAALEVNCQRTDRAMKAWQLETHATITQAWLKLERDYRDELAALEVQAASVVQGRNPQENRMLERAELRKFAITTLTAQHFDLFGAITFSPQGYPQPDLVEADAEGRYIRFFEQAFEWEQMMYVFYPYYWGRKSGWVGRSQLQDVDPQFAEFLKAGAARVVVPTRPGFEAAVAHFLDTGEIWEGADPPVLTSPLYVNIVQEIKERDRAPGTEVPQGPSWDVRLPTTLVRLRPDGSLPTWTKNAAGEWIPA